MKKEIKIEEDEMMELLNSDLRESIETHFFAGFLLRNKFFTDKFELEFIFDLTYVIKRREYCP